MSRIITLKDKQFRPYLSAEAIQERVAVLGRELTENYRDKQPFFLAILNGSFMFAADLLKQVDTNCVISFVKLASYRGTSSTGNVLSLIGLDENLDGREVIIVEDIIDTGRTLTEIKNLLKHHNPASLSVCSLLVKPDALEFDVDVHYRGFDIPNDFIVGYGLDYDGLGRNLKEIYQVV